MLEWFIKKWIVGKINGLLKEYSNNIEKFTQTLKIWTNRLKKVLTCFESLLAKIEDKELTSKEIEETTTDVTALIKEW